MFLRGSEKLPVYNRFDTIAESDGETERIPISVSCISVSDDTR